MKKRIISLLLGCCYLFLLSLSGCGDIGSVRVAVAFPDSETELKTRALLFVVREVPQDRSGCDDLWLSQPSGLAESRSIVEFPNRNDMVAAPVKLDIYPKLTLLIYAHTTKDVVNSQPIAGGCREIPVDANATSEVAIKLEKPPT